MKRVLLTILIAIAVAPAMLCGVRMLRFSPEQIAARADGVFVGAIESVSSHDSANGATTWSDYQIQIREMLKGEFQSSFITLSFADGGPDGSGGGLVGVPKLEVGREYLFFLESTPNVPCPTIGWQQGIFVEAVDPLLQGNQRVLVSLEGDPLWIDEMGGIVRGDRVVLHGDQIEGLAPTGRDVSKKLANPTPLPGSEAATSQLQSPPVSSERRSTDTASHARGPSPTLGEGEIGDRHATRQDESLVCTRGASSLCVELGGTAQRRVQLRPEPIASSNVAARGS